MRRASAYASLINAHVNSGDLPGAAAVFDRMRAQGLRANVVVCTALLKGYCRSGDLPAAMKASKRRGFRGPGEVLEAMLQEDPPAGSLKRWRLESVESPKHRFKL